MAEVLAFPEGGYRYVRGVFQYSWPLRHWVKKKRKRTHNAHIYFVVEGKGQIFASSWTTTTSSFQRPFPYSCLQTRPFVKYYDYAANREEVLSSQDSPGLPLLVLRRASHSPPDGTVIRG